MLTHYILYFIASKIIFQLVPTNKYYEYEIYLYDIEYFFSSITINGPGFNTLSLMIHWTTCVSLIVLLRDNWRVGTIYMS